MYRLIATICLALGLAACGSTVSETNSVTANYLDNSMRDDRLSGGVKMIPIETAKGRSWALLKR